MFFEKNYMVRIVIYTLSLLIVISCNNNSKLKDENRNKKSNECNSYYYDEELKENIYLFTPQMPFFKGGNSAFLNYFTSNYEPVGTEKHSFSFEIVIGRNGEVLSVKIANKESLNEAEDSAIKVIKDMPDWVPGSCRNERVSIKVVKSIRI